MYSAMILVKVIAGCWFSQHLVCRLKISFSDIKQGSETVQILWPSSLQFQSDMLVSLVRMTLGRKDGRDR